MIWKVSYTFIMYPQWWYIFHLGVPSIMEIDPHYISMIKSHIHYIWTRQIISIALCNLIDLWHFHFLHRNGPKAVFAFAVMALGLSLAVGFLVTWWWGEWGMGDRQVTMVVSSCFNSSWSSTTGWVGVVPWKPPRVEVCWGISEKISLVHLMACCGTSKECSGFHSQLGGTDGCSWP